MPLPINSVSATVSGPPPEEEEDDGEEEEDDGDDEEAEAEEADADAAVCWAANAATCAQPCEPYASLVPMHAIRCQPGKIRDRQEMQSKTTRTEMSK